MKILCLADLHRCSDIYKEFDKYQDEWLKRISSSCDIIVIAGDIFESKERKNPYQVLSELFDNKLVICVLGNHEFVYNTVEDTLKKYQDLYNPDKYNVHYLDIVGSYQIKHFNFIGNVLWYDGSLATVQNQNLNNFANSRWLDRFIKDFDFLKEHQKCVKQIEDNFRNNYINILVTHCIPHYKLNIHMQLNKFNEFNVYSGVYNLFDKIKPDYAICGHTHKRCIGLIIEGCKCINVGNDYYPPFLHYELSI